MYLKYYVRSGGIKRRNCFSFYRSPRVSWCKWWKEFPDIMSYLWFICWRNIHADVWLVRKAFSSFYRTCYPHLSRKHLHQLKTNSTKFEWNKQLAYSHVSFKLGKVDNTCLWKKNTTCPKKIVPFFIFFF